MALPEWSIDTHCNIPCMSNQCYNILKSTYQIDETIPQVNFVQTESMQSTADHTQVYYIYTYAANYLFLSNHNSSCPWTLCNTFLNWEAGFTEFTDTVQEWFAFKISSGYGILTDSRSGHARFDLYIKIHSRPQHILQHSSFMWREDFCRIWFWHDSSSMSMTVTLTLKKSP